MSKQTLSFLLLACTVLLGALGVATLLPIGNMRTSDLYYYSFCPFAPWSTLTLFFLAWLGWAVREHIHSPHMNPPPPPAQKPR